MRPSLLAAVLAATIACASPVHAQSATTMTYQGQLNDAGALANGDYEFEFRLLDENATQIGTIESLTAVVTNGIFSAALDFGPGAFDGTARALEISVRPALSGDAFTVLSPNAPITAAPVAQFALAGNKGPQGPAGPTGPQGPQGNDGTTPWGPGSSNGIRYDGGLVEIRSSGPDWGLEVRKDGVTRLAVNANGGVSLGTGSTAVQPGTVYVFQKLGIGNSVPVAELDVVGSGVVRGRLSVGDPLGGTGPFIINSFGDAGKPGGGLWTFFSDRRLKKNITPMTGSLDTIAALRPMAFEFTNEDHFSYIPGVQRGLIAQDVQAVIPEWVKQADDGYYTLDMAGYEALIIGAIQDLRAEKDTQIAELEQQNKELQVRLERMEKIILRSGMFD